MASPVAAMVSPAVVMTSLVRCVYVCSLLFALCVFPKAFFFRERPVPKGKKMFRTVIHAIGSEYSVGAVAGDPETGSDEEGGKASRSKYDDHDNDDSGASDHDGEDHQKQKKQLRMLADMVKAGVHPKTGKKLNKQQRAKLQAKHRALSRKIHKHAEL